MNISKKRSTIAKAERSQAKASKDMAEQKKSIKSNRQANCCYGKHAIVDSSPELPFFESRPNFETDTYYCGCYGFD